MGWRIRSRSVVWATIAALAAGLSARAQVADEPTEIRLSLDVKGKQLTEVVEWLRERTGARIELVKNADGLGHEDFCVVPTTCLCTDRPWTEVLRLAAEGADFSVRRTGDAWHVFPQPWISLDAGRHDVRALVTPIAAKAGVTVAYGVDVPADAATALAEPDRCVWHDALRVVARGAGLCIVPDEARRAWAVHTPAFLEGRLERRALPVRYLKPRWVSEGRDRSGLVFERGAGPLLDLAAAARAELVRRPDGTPLGSVHVISDALHLHALPSDLARVAALLAELDRPVTVPLDPAARLAALEAEVAAAAERLRAAEAALQAAREALDQSRPR